MQNRPSTIDELCKYTEGKLLELPGFGEGQPFLAKLKRPSMLSLIRKGKIPNSLLVTASSLFAGKLDVTNNEDDNNMSNLFEVLDTICEAAFVEPTWKEIREAGIELTDEQYMAVFNYTQQGVKALEPFRSK